MDFDIIEQLLGSPPDAPLWQVAATASRKKVLASWLSTVVARDIEISSGARDYLDRVRRRVATLHDVGAQVRDRTGVTVIKGERLARHLPSWLLRNSGDADLVADDERMLWRAVTDVRDSCGAIAQSVSVLRTATEQHFVIAMKWPAEEPLLDKPLGADVATCAFCGDVAAGAPPRTAMSDDEDILGLHTVAEERFQRKFSVKDLLDFLVLSRRLDQRLDAALADRIVAETVELRRAPELANLVAKTASWVELGPHWAGIEQALAAEAAVEKRRRAARTEELPTVYYGYPLDTVPHPGEVAEFHLVDGLELATTPVGTCLLLSGEELTLEELERARQVAASLAG
ncbi:MAG: hypothetical protein JO144_07525 [Actinobacteria bacterium]|nr:hypothetical protein [Actinomycetota bacterium]